jgi:hypothetical protein
MPSWSFNKEISVNISAISMLPLQGAADPAALAGDSARLAKEFDAMLLRLMLGDLGKSMAGGNEVLGQVLAEHLATTVDLGLGTALLGAAAQGARPGAEGDPLGAEGDQP